MERNTVLFTPEGKATPGMLRLWTAKGALQTIAIAAPILEPDRSAKPHFRNLWVLAFPTRDVLPFGPIADKAGIGSDQFWERFA